MLLLQEILKDWPCTVTGGDYRVEVLGVTEYSRNVKPGFVFVARKGKIDDGAIYINEAVRSGAVAIIVDRTIIADLPQGIPIIIVPDCRKFISHASAILAGNPSERLTVIAVTGTNGKTTVTRFLGQLLMNLGVNVAVIGTTGILIGNKLIDFESPNMTTLPAEFLHPLLSLCEAKGVTHIVLEASSLGLESHRLAHCEIDIGILLNISKDHYDEHGGREAYMQAKKILLRVAKKMIVNSDDLACMSLAKEVDRLYTYFGTGNDAHLRLVDEGEVVFVNYGDRKEPLLFSIIGRFNQMNALAAISALHSLWYSVASVSPYIPLLKLPEGRMEKLDSDGLSVIIDYAHTPDALEVVLRSLKKICTGRLITVFGCGGGRDKGKRKEMGEIASIHSEIVYVTSDNPRNEDPSKIIEAIIEGMDFNKTTIEIEPNRAIAIQKAIYNGYKNDIILIAGKGHEKTQQIGKKVFPFSDIEEAKTALQEKKMSS